LFDRTDGGAAHDNTLAAHDNTLKERTTDPHPATARTSNKGGALPFCVD
jgi:hypothetical protein